LVSGAGADAPAAGLSVGASPAGARPGQAEGDDQGSHGEGDGQSGSTVEVEAGIGGWVVPSEAYPVHVTVATDRLVDGRWTASGELAAVADRDPFDPTDITEVALPAGVLADGQVYARISYVSGVAPMWAFNVREANTCSIEIDDEP
jgi:hypothetical protein